jgi:hypothetical protein
VWRWEGLSLPAGLRQGPFRCSVPTETSARAVATFGPDGLEGKLYAGPFRNVSDAVVVALPESQLTPGERHALRPLAVSLAEDGTFRATGRDALPPGRYLAGTLLSDRQQRRQELYRQFLHRPPAHLLGRTVLFCWADPIDTHFRFPAGARQAGDALLVVPLEYRPPEAGARVTVPGPLVSYRRLQDDLIRRLTTEGGDELEQQLRFQLPAPVLGMQVERARLTARVEAPSRRVVVSAGGSEVHNAEAPDVLRVEIDKPGLLTLDPEGGLRLSVRISDLPGGKKQGASTGSDGRWKIHYLELEVVGKAR